LPVEEHGQLLGLLTLHRISAVPPQARPTTRVEDVMIPRQKLKTVSPDDDLATVMERMADEDVNQFPVMSDGRLEGMVARDGLLGFIQLHSAGTSAT
jgi:CBS domain-containing protein